jgi:ATP-dependent Zn protease
VNYYLDNNGILQLFYPKTISLNSKMYLDSSFNMIDKEVSLLVNEAFMDAKNNILNNKEQFDIAVNELLKKTTLSEYEFNLIIYHS